MVRAMYRTWRVSDQSGIRCYPTHIQAAMVVYLLVDGYGRLID